jgi:hypothetical protein
MAALADFFDFACFSSAPASPSAGAQALVKHTKSAAIISLQRVFIRDPQYKQDACSAPLLRRCNTRADGSNWILSILSTMNWIN